MCVGEKTGFIDATGKVIIPIQYDAASNFAERLCVVSIGKKVGCIDSLGNVVLPLQYGGVVILGRNLFSQVKNDTTRLYFAFGKYNMTETEWLRCDSLLAAWQYIDLQFVEIEGHTDIVSGQEFNQQLSKQRAETVYEYLWKKGVAAEKISIAAYNFAQPAQSNHTNTGRAATYDEKRHPCCIFQKVIFLQRT